MNLTGCLFISIFLCLSGYFSFGQKEDYRAKIDSLVEDTSQRPFNGVILITRKGNTTYAKAYGYANFDKKEKLEIGDSFVILSNSKQITAVLILQQVDKGSIDLDKPIRNYLPDFNQSWADTVTVHHLLNHTSGIADLGKPLAFRPGSHFKYTDLNYILLGKILESLLNTTYQTVAGDLFKRCGMKNTYAPEANSQALLVDGHRYDKDNIRKEIKGITIARESIPAAGIVTTAADLSAWNNQLHGGKLLTRATYKRMISYSIKARHPVFGDKELGYGYGIRVNDMHRPVELGHTGIVPSQGFTSLNLYYPDTKTSVIVLENQAFDNSEISYYFEKAIRQIVLQSKLLKKD